MPKPIELTGEPSDAGMLVDPLGHPPAEHKDDNNDKTNFCAEGCHEIENK